MLFNKKSELNNFRYCIHFHLGCEFFKTQSLEFTSFYNNIMIPPHKSYFNKFYRYKFWLEDNDYQDVYRLMIKKGQALKYKNFLLNMINDYFKLELSKYNESIKYIFLYTELYLTWWLYDFKLLYKQIQFFKCTYHKIDKQVKKFTRKRDIKYQTKFNYIPPFKRKKWLLKEYIKSIDYMPHTTYSEKLLNLTIWWTNDFKTTYLFRNRRRIYWQILKNKYKTTLLKSY